eukprot:g47503.t1
MFRSVRLSLACRVRSPFYVSKFVPLLDQNTVDEIWRSSDEDPDIAARRLNRRSQIAAKFVAEPSKLSSLPRKVMMSAIFSYVGKARYGGHDQLKSAQIAANVAGPSKPASLPKKLGYQPF